MLFRSVSQSRYTNATINSNGNDIDFVGNIEGLSSGGQSLTISAGSGTVSFLDSVGLVPLSSINVTAGQINLGGNMSASGNITIQGPLILNGVNSYFTSTSGDITFASTVNPETLGDGNLTLTLSGGDVFLNADLGGIGSITEYSEPIGSLSIIGATNVYDLANIKTHGSIYIEGLIELQKDIGMFSDTGSIVLKQAVSPISSGVQSLTLSALSVEVDASISLLNSLTILSSTAIVSSLQTTGNILVSSAITLNAAATISSTSGNITLESFINGAYDLVLTALNGELLYDTIGGQTPLRSVTISAGTIKNFADITTLGGDITINQSCSFNKSTIFTAVNGDIDIQGSVNAVTAGSGAESLTLNVENGSVTILGAVGDTQRLGGFSIPLASGLGVSIGGSILTDSEAVAGGIVQIAPNLILSANTLIDTQGSGKGGTLSLGAVTMTGSYSLNCEAGIGSISIASLSSPLTNALLQVKM